MTKQILGILGGMGPQATIRFYDLLIHTSIEKYCVRKNADFPHVLINNIPVPDLVMSKEDEERTVSMVEDEARRLRQAGCTVLAMPCNTMHLYIDRLREASGLPFISMIDAVIERLKNDHISKIGLLGTITTMESSLYTAPLSQAGIRVILPDDKDQQIIGSLVHAVIANSIQPSHIEIFAKIIDQLSSKGVEAVLLGCTELPLIAQQMKIDLKLYDSPAILAEKCCELLPTCTTKS